jgi:hypothetical protein
MTPGTPLRYWPALFFCLLISCSSAPRLSSFSAEYHTSRDGLLRYRIPAGWLNATSDSLSADAAVWLVQKDFSATLSVKEIVIDVETRRELQRSGLKRLAELTLALTSGENGVSVIEPPRTALLEGRYTCVYEYTTGHSRDTVRVILLDTGETLYDVSLLMTDKAAAHGEAAALQDMFVQNLEW